MARKRMLHPPFFTDAELWDALPDWGLLLYEGMWCECDDSGCITSHPGTLKATCLPCRDNVTKADVLKVVKVLVDLGHLVPYQAGPPESPKTYYWLSNFHRWQTLDHPSPPKLPLPEWVTWHDEGDSRRAKHYEVH